MTVGPSPVPEGPVTYRTGNDLDLDEVIELYHGSTLGMRRPVADRACMAGMLRHANLIITAWQGERLVGIARTLTDFCYVAYLADLAVHRDYQRQGIGAELIRRTQGALGPRAKIVLLAAPAAAGYYPRVGFVRHPQAWVLPARGEVRG